MTASTSTDTGRRAEAQAQRYLTAQGLRTVTKNYRSPHGEIDLVMRDGHTLVFVEVRYRGDSRFVHPSETVDARKRRRLTRTAEHFLQRHASLVALACRFDVVSIDGGSHPARLEWISDAFEAEPA